MDFQIGLTEVLKKIRGGDEKHSFSLTYRKENGMIGAKKEVQNRFSDLPVTDKGKRALSSIDKETQRAGKLHLVESSGRIFDLTICLLISYNGKLIDHTK
jgi:hypothetical protein